MATSAAQRWLRLVVTVGKPAVLLVMALSVESIALGVAFALTGSVAVNVLLFGAAVFGAVGGVIAAFRRRRRTLGADALSSLLYALLAVLGAGPFAVVLAVSARQQPQDKLPLLGFAAVAAGLALIGVRQLAQLWKRR